MAQLERDLDEQLERAATRAFRDSFLIGAGLALVALLTVVGPPEAERSDDRPRCSGRPAGVRAGPGERRARRPGRQRGRGRSSRSGRPTRAPPATVTSRADGIEGLTERLVLLGIDGAACQLQVSREALTLELARPGTRTEAEIDALREGLQSAVRRMKADGSLPPASDLVDEALESADLNDFLKTLIRALPDSVVDAALKTDDILTRTIDDLDLRDVLANLDDQNDLNQQVEAAVTQAVKDSLADRLRDLL